MHHPFIVSNEPPLSPYLIGTLSQMEMRRLPVASVLFSSARRASLLFSQTAELSERFAAIGATFFIGRLASLRARVRRHERAAAARTCPR
jgi:hypothetical protein